MEKESEDGRGGIVRECERKWREKRAKSEWSETRKRRENEGERGREGKERGILSIV
jgi:hypothetical protein